MITVEEATPSPEPTYRPSLADLSRNASVISTSSSSEDTHGGQGLLNTPGPSRPRPLRTFSSPRSRSPGGPTTPRSTRPPAYLTRELGLPDDHPQVQAQQHSRSRNASKSKSRTRSRSAGRPSADDYDFGQILGEGSYSTVLQATHRTTGQEYAIKIIDKSHLIRHNKLQTAHAEKNTLIRLRPGHPGIVRLHAAFHDEWSLFYVLDLAKNGELQSRISRLGSLSLECSRYYAAQLVDALDYMHSKGVLHRDLKPENILLDDAFRIKITDFGTGKVISEGESDAPKTFVGSAPYVSPELLERNETSKSSDLWAFGTILYQMIAGRFAFHGLTEYLTWQKIKALDYTFPEGFDEQAKDLITKILVKDPSLRLGAGHAGSDNSMSALRSHPFFSTINWETLWTVPAPTLEPGLVRREDLGTERQWEDVGAAWDALVGGGKGGRGDSAVDSEDDEDEDFDTVEEGGGGGQGGKRVRIADVGGGDGIEWARDGEGTEFSLFGAAAAGMRKNGNGNGNGLSTPLEELGPLGELPDYAERLGMGLGTREIASSSSAFEEDDEEGNDKDAASERTTLAPKIHRSRVNGNGALQFQLAEPQRDSLVRDGENDEVVDMSESSSHPQMPSGTAGTAVEDPDTAVGAQSDTSSETSEYAGPVGGGMIMGTGMGTGILEDDEPPEGQDVSASPRPGVGDLGAVVGTIPAAADVDSGVDVVMKSEPIAVPGHVRNSRSLTGSSDGSPVEKLGAAWGATFSRGRLRTRAPIVEVPVAEPDWSSVLSPGERLLYHSAVEETVLKRRTSRLLLPIPVAPRKPKLRQLALTSHRLLCLKQQHKGGRNVVIKCEYGLRPSEKEKEKEREKESRRIITGVGKKSEREFVVFTTTKSAFFAAESDEVANEWMKKIQESLERHGAEHRERKLSNAAVMNPSSTSAAADATNANNTPTATPKTGPSSSISPSKPTTPPRPLNDSRASYATATPSPGP